MDLATPVPRHDLEGVGHGLIDHLGVRLELKEEKITVAFANSDDERLLLEFLSDPAMSEAAGGKRLLVKVVGDMQLSLRSSFPPTL